MRTAEGEDGGVLDAGVVDRGMVDGGVVEHPYVREEPGGFAVLERSGPVARLVGGFPTASRRLACVIAPTGRAVVLGSSQDERDIDPAACRARGFAICRRKSGGGAVVIDPDSTVWIDLFLPAHDERFVRDVAAAGHWVGDLWGRSLRALGDGGAAPVTHRGPMERSAWSDQCCFAGLGPGEVTVGGRKVVGLSQRRTRAGAWFFTVAYVGGDPGSAAQLLALDDGERGELAEALRSGVGTLSGVTPTQVVEAVVAQLGGT